VRRLPPYRVRGREWDFDRGVRARDGKCVFTGLVNKNADVDYWAGFEAAHIFPLEKESCWIEHGFSQFITNADSGNAPIHSIQNGFLLDAGAHQLFNDYAISVNPDVSDFILKTYTSPQSQPTSCGYGCGLGPWRRVSI
jgi:hypothetical protein